MQNLQVFSQGNPDFSIMFYNVENLFDTIDDKSKDDNEFLPQSEKKWNTYRFYAKIKNISRVIAAAGEWHNPDIIGMCEIENSQCLWSLTHSTALSKFQYNSIHFDSRDSRGIDVGILYNPQTFKPSIKRRIPIYFPKDSLATTRDILYVKGTILKSLDTIHVFVCHFPSRRGGERKSEPKRIFVASVLKSKVDSINAAQKNAQIVIIGDFNDDPSNTSIKKTLGATVEPANCANCLTNVVDAEALGTHYYKGIWSTLDQTIISNTWFANYKVENTVVSHDFLFTQSKKSGDKSPYRTYAATRYIGGYSDHLPVIVKFYKK